MRTFLSNTDFFRTKRLDEKTLRDISEGVHFSALPHQTKLPLNSSKILPLSMALKGVNLTLKNVIKNDYYFYNLRYKSILQEV